MATLSLHLPFLMAAVIDQEGEGHGDRRDQGHGNRREQGHGNRREQGHGTRREQGHGKKHPGHKVDDDIIDEDESANEIMTRIHSIFRFTNIHFCYSLPNGKTWSEVKVPTCGHHLFHQMTLGKRDKIR